MDYRTPAELPDEHRLFVPENYKKYRPITDPVFQSHFPSSEFPNEEFDKVEEFDTNLQSLQKP